MSLRTNELPVVPFSKDLKFVVDSNTENITGLASMDIFESKLADRFVGGGISGKQLELTWEQLKERTKTGDFKGIHIGDWKEITLTGGEKVVMEVAGIDTYCRCGDKEIGHHIDFISRDCLKTAKVMNDTATNNGNSTSKNPFLASTLNKYLNSTVYGMLPEDLKPCIIKKRALLEVRYDAQNANLVASSGWDWMDMGYLWIPFEREVFGDSVWGEQSWSGGGGCNIQYPIFENDALHRIKHKSYESILKADWWLASARTALATEFCVADNCDVASSTTASKNDIHVAFGFRVAQPVSS